MKNDLLVDSSVPNALASECVAPIAEIMPEAQRLSPVIMLLGRPDKPTDAVRDYTQCLREALERRGLISETFDIRWDGQGWLAALAKLWKQSRDWRGRWIVLHYTALMWSRRGFPLVLPVMLKILRLRGCRSAVVFHDLYAVPGPRLIDRLRVSSQERIMRHLAANACRAIVPVSPENVSWFPAQNPGVDFIPVGVNIPSLDELAGEGFVPARNEIPTVAVFGIPTWPEAQTREVKAIVESVRTACLQAGELRVLVLGRGAKEAEPLLRARFSGTGVRLQVDGVRSGHEISTALSSCDVLLFVRGSFSTRRGSGLAALACGLPVVAYRGRETGFPLTEAGIVFVPQDDIALLGHELARVLLDRELRLRLKERNLEVFREWFSWDRIAERWLETLRPNNEGSTK
jgi:glycosyltransferase involved in cell wall biosynthesis